MTELNAQVVAFVERQLKKNPDASSTELQQKAIKIDKSVSSLSGRQFHARYALQVRRKLAGTLGARKPSSGSRKRSAHGGNLAQTVLADSYEEKKAALDAAIRSAFERAIEADSLLAINKLLLTLDRHARDFGKV